MREFGGGGVDDMVEERWLGREEKGFGVGREAGGAESRERSCKPAPPTRSDPSSSSFLLKAEVAPIDSPFDSSASLLSSALSISEPIEDLRPRLDEGPGE